MAESTAPGTDLLHLLNELALDLHWSWDHATDRVWHQLDPVLWELTHNPFVVLQTVSRQQVQEVLSHPQVSDLIQDLAQKRRTQAAAPAWFQVQHPNASLSCVAFFSMEFMLSEALPIYSGGLGNVAGDHLKAASDMGVPVIGVGLLYQQGYSRQVINEDGTQQYLFPYNDPGQLPITPLRDATGEWLRIEVKLPGYSVWLRTWKVLVGRVTLFLLDSNDAANYPVHRGITSELYGGGAELRLQQEMVLGIGGWRLLQELGIRPEVCHLNEGHTAFAVLERAAAFMEEHGQPFDAALATTRSGNIFTTHTAIGAGFDRFPPSLMKQYLGGYATKRLHISLQELMALGRLDAANESEPFNIAYLAIRGSGSVNGVSRLHGRVSREILASLFPRWPQDEVPVGTVTNGVHMPTWDSPQADRIWTEACGKDRWRGPIEPLEHHMRSISDNRLWDLRCAGKKEFLDYIRKRFAREIAIRGHAAAKVKAAEALFDDKALTLGFARRFVSYKRPNLLLHDPHRLQRLLTNQDRPVQMVIAGKAHPADPEGQAMIRQWIEFIGKNSLRHRILFLSDYDMLLTKQMVQGVDVWINTPLRPWEACGTSGMKVLVNGGLNLSVLDGWWDEAWEPDRGWAIGKRNGILPQGRDDAADAAALYDLLEGQVIPEYYNRNEEGLPLAWINRMRESMAHLTPVYSASRSVIEYTERYYLPAARSYLARAANDGETGSKIAEWTRCAGQRWKALRFNHLAVETKEGLHFFRVQLHMGTFKPRELRVELYAEASEGRTAVRQEMIPAEHETTGDTCLFSTTAPADRPAGYFTPRVIPRNTDIAIPLECGLILWEK